MIYYTDLQKPRERLGYQIKCKTCVKTINKALESLKMCRKADVDIRNPLICGP